MPVAVRDARGRAKSKYETEALYGLVRVIATEACPENPEGITQRAFDGARASTGHPDAPKATTICARLVEPNGKPMAWRRVLNLALDDDRSLEHLERQRTSQPDAHHLDQRHVIYALRFIALRGGAKSLTPSEYAEARRAVVSSERRRNCCRQLQAELLPTVGQIERIMGDDDDQHDQRQGSAAWDRALTLAKLAPRAELHVERRHRGPYSDSLPLIEAIHHYVEANGELPSKNRFQEFRALADIRVEHRPGRWADHLDAAIAYRRTLGLTDPTEHPTIAAGRRKDRRAVQAPADGIPGVGRRLGKGRRKYSEEDCIAALRRYLEKGERPHRVEGYRSFARAQGLPAPRAFDSYGGWGALRAKAQSVLNTELQNVDLSD